MHGIRLARIKCKNVSVQALFHAPVVNSEVSTPSEPIATTDDTLVPLAKNRWYTGDKPKSE